MLVVGAGSHTRNETVNSVSKNEYCRM
jgi:hypothetical protein